MPFLSGHAGSETLALWLSELARGRPGLKVHLYGHSTGAILLGKLQELAPDLRISSCSLFAPAAPVALFERHYYPHLVAPSGRFAVHYADGCPNSITESITHGGFDNDVATMNSVLRTILGAEPRQPFTKEIRTTSLSVQKSGPGPVAPTAPIRRLCPAMGQLRFKPAPE